MARRLRNQFPGARYHVINPGNLQHNIFATDGACRAVICVIGDLCGLRPFLVRDVGERALWLNTSGARLRYHTLWRRVYAQVSRLGGMCVASRGPADRSCTTELIRAGANSWHVRELLATSNSTPWSTM